jgi:hypothetical protein
MDIYEVFINISQHTPAFQFMQHINKSHDIGGVKYATKRHSYTELRLIQQKDVVRNVLCHVKAIYLAGKVFNLSYIQGSFGFHVTHM